MMMDRWQYENYMDSIERKMKKQTASSVVTNADRIRGMTDEELAEFLNTDRPSCTEFCEDFKGGCRYMCPHNYGTAVILQWLKKETK